MVTITLFVRTPDFLEREGLPISLATFPSGPLDESVMLAKRLGYDGIEILAGDPEAIDAGHAADVLARHGMTISAINTGGMNYMFDISLVNADPKKEEMAFRKLQAAIRIAGRLGCLTQIGIARGNAVKGRPIAWFRDRLVDVLRAACDYAGSHHASIVLEPTNRFEHGTVHTIDEGIRIIERVSKPNLGLLIDTYHSYIEEDDVYAAIERARDHVRYFHLHDSDRGPAGGGNGVIDFDRIFRILSDIGYSGYLADGLLTMELPEDLIKRSTGYLHERIASYRL